MSDAYKKNDLDTVKTIYQKSAINQFIIAVLIFLGLAINLDNIFEIIPKRFEPGRYVILLIALTNVVRMASGTDMSVIAYSKYFKITTVLLTTFLITLVTLNIAFIPSMGIIGAALASLLAASFFTLMKVSFIYWKFKFQPYNYHYLLILAFSAIIYFLITLIPPLPHFIIDIIVRSSIAVIVYSLFIYLGKFSEDINQSADNLVKRLFKLFK